MTVITSQMIKELREKSGAGMMDCKKALEENGGNFEKAVDWLRTKGLASAAKKSSRVTAEGLVSAKTNANLGVMVEINAETDFVARNDQFISLTEKITNHLLSTAETDIEKFKASKLSNGNTIADEIQNSIAVIGENINLRRIVSLKVNKGVVISYVHSAVKEGMGKIGVLVALETDASIDKVQAVGKQIAMHIAAAKPESLNIESLDPSLIQRERDIFADQARQSGKPESIIEKMIEGRIRKFYEEAVLLEQVFVIDGKTKIQQVIDDLSKSMGTPVKIVNFVRFALGEGVEKQESNFAAEVAAAAGTTK